MYWFACEGERERAALCEFRQRLHFSQLFFYGVSRLDEQKLELFSNVGKISLALSRALRLSHTLSVSLRRSPSLSHALRLSLFEIVARCVYICWQRGERLGCWLAIPPFRLSTIPPFRHSATSPLRHFATLLIRHSVNPPICNSAHDFLTFFIIS